MGELADFVKHYFDTTPSEQLRRDWEELKEANNHGPNILDVINNYGRGRSVHFTKLTVSNVYITEFSSSLTDSELCLAA